MKKIKKKDVEIIHSTGEDIYGKEATVVVAVAAGHLSYWTIPEVPDEEGWEEHYKFLFAQQHNDKFARKDEIIAEREAMEEMVSMLGQPLDEAANYEGTPQLELVPEEEPEDTEPFLH